MRRNFTLLESETTFCWKLKVDSREFRVEGPDAGATEGPDAGTAEDPDDGAAEDSDAGAAEDPYA
jgi:hypothetical protein